MLSFFKSNTFSILFHSKNNNCLFLTKFSVSKVLFKSLETFFTCLLIYNINKLWYLGCFENVTAIFSTSQSVFTVEFKLTVIKVCHILYVMRENNGDIFRLRLMLSLSCCQRFLSQKEEHSRILWDIINGKLLLKLANYLQSLVA